jgi:hypothetical protein
VSDLLPDDLTTDALGELTRLAREAERFAKGRYPEAMASLSAMEPLKTMLVDECCGRWFGAGEAMPGDATHLGGYL